MKLMDRGIKDIDQLAGLTKEKLIQYGLTGIKWPTNQLGQCQMGSHYRVVIGIALDFSEGTENT